MIGEVYVCKPAASLADELGSGVKKLFEYAIRHSGCYAGCHLKSNRQLVIDAAIKPTRRRGFGHSARCGLRRHAE